MKIALIFGITGQDGSLLAKSLLEKDYRVIGVSRDAESRQSTNFVRLEIQNKVNVVSASINDFRSVLQVLSKYAPDEIYNLAGQSSVGLSFDQPVETFESISIANLNLLEAIRFLEIPTKYYNACSSEVFGDTNGAAVTEESVFRPKSPYGVAKAASFWQVANYREAYSIFACSGILFNHESYLRPERFVTQKIVKAACRISKGSNEKLVLGNISISRDWGWAPEYVEGMWLILQQRIPNDFIIATGETYSLKSFISSVFENLSLNWEEHVVYNSSFNRPSDIYFTKANPVKAEKMLGWKAKYKMLDVVLMMIEAEMSGQQ